MYVLVLIMTLQDEMQIRAHDVLFTDYFSCKEVAAPIEERLVNTKPSPEATAVTYCIQLPTST